jgi:hypothetical protein
MEEEVVQGGYGVEHHSFGAMSKEAHQGWDSTALEDRQQTLSMV